MTPGLDRRYPTSLVSDLKKFNSGQSSKLLNFFLKDHIIGPKNDRTIKNEFEILK